MEYKMNENNLAITIPMARYNELLAAYLNGKAVAKILQDMPYESESRPFVRIALELLEPGNPEPKKEEAE